MSQKPHEFETGAFHFDTVSIVDYNPMWPEQYKKIESLVAAVVDTGVRRIDHIGSTAVPGLRGKDRIDVQVTVDDLERAWEWVDRLLPLGFRHSAVLSRDHNPPGNSRGQQKLFLHKSSGRPFANIHVREWRRGSWSYALLIRDYLRASQAAAEAYGITKSRLAVASGGVRTTYGYVKDPICDLLYAAALEWAQLVQWDEHQYDRLSAGD